MNICAQSVVFYIKFLSLIGTIAAELTQEKPSKKLDGLKTFTQIEFEAPLEKAKHHASIRLTKDDYIFGEGHICSGALIAPSVVLTVGHCLFNYEKNSGVHPAELKIILGTSNRFLRTADTLVYGVTHIYRPKTFDPHTLRDNIAIIMLERDIPQSHPTVQAASMYLEQLETTHSEDSLKYYELTSWNALYNGIGDTTLISLKATSVANLDCSNGYSNFYFSGNICVKYEDFVYPKDDGAPLMYGSKLVGLNIFRGTKENLPAVFVNVSSYEKWIREQIGDGTNHNSSIWGSLGFAIFTIFTIKTSNWVKF